MKKILVYGYGNPGRQDDGLGIELALAIEKWAMESEYLGIDVDTNYQLNIEDSYNLKTYDIVVFTDASVEDISAFKYERLYPKLAVNFSMHAVEPEFVLALCEQMYDVTPMAYLLHIKGYNWEFMEDMSTKASKNLRKAKEFLQSEIESYIFSEISK